MDVRADGRRTDELRPISIVYEGLDRADGSARFSFGQSTSTLTSVSGPIEPRPQSEHPSLTTLEIHVRPLHSLPSTQSRHAASVLKSIFSQAILLNQNPRTLVQMVVQALSVSEVVERTGIGAGSARVYGPGTIASMVNSASLAFINAGSVPLRGTVCAVAVGRVTKSSQSTTSFLVLDPSPDELTTVTAQGVFAFLFSSALPAPASGQVPPGELIWSNWHSTSLGTTNIGEGGEDELGRARELAKEGATKAWWEMKGSIGGMEAGAQQMHTKAESGNVAIYVTRKGKIDNDAEGKSEDEDEKMEI